MPERNRIEGCKRKILGTYLFLTHSNTQSSGPPFHDSKIGWNTRRHLNKRSHPFPNLAVNQQDNEGGSSVSTVSPRLDWEPGFWLCGATARDNQSSFEEPRDRERWCHRCGQDPGGPEQSPSAIKNPIDDPPNVSRLSDLTFSRSEGCASFPDPPDARRGSQGWFEVLWSVAVRILSDSRCERCPTPSCAQANPAQRAFVRPPPHHALQRAANAPGLRRWRPVGPAFLCLRQQGQPS